METAIDGPAAFLYSTVAFTVHCETTNCDALVRDDGLQNELIVAEFNPAQG